ncbi:MAG: 3-dehydroquinate synthase, partial [Verrucomicrobiota bacterium]
SARKQGPHGRVLGDVVARRGAADSLQEHETHAAAAQAEQVRAALTAHGLPERLREPLPLDRLLAAMRRDKKVRGGRMRFVLLEGIGGAATSDDVAEDSAVRALLSGGAAR